MDGDQFDYLTRNFGEDRLSRRTASRLLVAGPVAAVLGWLGRDETAAKKRNKRTCPKKRCRPGYERDPRTCRCQCRRRRCNGGKEFDLQSCSCECARGLQECADGTCIGRDRCCPGERRCSSGGCVPKDACCFDEKRCTDGSCLLKDGGICCPHEQSCTADPTGCCNTIAGEECSADGCCNTFVGQAICNGRCVDIDTDPRNCGGCGTTCGCGQTCQGGACVGDVVPCCQPGESFCNGRCMSFKWDHNNCGGCGVKCGSCEYCDNGTCRRSCQPGWDCCGTVFCCEVPGGSAVSGTSRVRRKGLKRDRK